jgi:copper type II ascorbate-dependent monooxygenase-like protein
MRWVCVGVVVVAACHATSPSHPDGDVDAPSDADAGWTQLVARSWTVNPNSESYRCTRIQVTSDMWVTGFRALAPVGTHHAVLTISSTSSPLGDYDCTPSNLDQQLLYASGVATDDLLFPQGVAIHLTAGMYINLNLHLYNATDAPITETSGVLVRTIDASKVVNEADMTFAGTFNISIPNDNLPHTAYGGCTIPSDWHVFALWPHMHQTAIHQQMVVTHAMQPTTMLDVPYAFSEQKNYPMQDTLLHTGDILTTTCTYQNDTSINPMTYGDSTDAEMCFTGIYKYPAGGGLYACTSS